MENNCIGNVQLIIYLFFVFFFVTLTMNEKSTSQLIVKSEIFLATSRHSIQLNSNFSLTSST